MDMVTLGNRIARAREDAEMTQDGLGVAVELERSAISRLESGERKLNVPELVRIAAALRRPLAFFVEEPVPAVVSRRTDLTDEHTSTRRLDYELEMFASDLRGLVSRGLLVAPARFAVATPRDNNGAEKVARKLRQFLKLGYGPVEKLSSVVERVGLFMYVVPMGKGGPDGACVEVEAGEVTVGAAVINADAPSGRRRMTIAHELGHWVFGDAYDSSASSEAEALVRAFAIHFLAPREGVLKVWEGKGSWATRDRVLFVAAHFRISWTAATAQVRNLNLIDRAEFELLRQKEPRAGDYMRLELDWERESTGAALSPGYLAGAMEAYSNGQLTQSRTLELLRETVAASDLPVLPEPSLDDLRMSFQGHGA